MKKTAPREHPKTLKELARQTRMALGLPITAVGSIPPIGYRFCPDNKKLLLPNSKLLRALYHGMIAKDNGYSSKVVSKWIYRNTKIKTHLWTIDNCYHTRIFLKEILLPLDERRRIYQTTFQEEGAEAEVLYQDYIRRRAWGRPKGDREEQGPGSEGEDEAESFEESRIGSEDWSGYSI